MDKKFIQYNKIERIKIALTLREESYVVYGFIKSIIKLRNKSLKFRYSLLKNKLRKEFSVSFKDLKNEKKYLKEILGDFSEYISSQNENKNLIIASADRFVNKEFSLLGGHISFNDEIDWSKDFKSGFKWPQGKFYLKYNQVDLNNNADVKVPRELSRSHHFLILGQAYLITKDEKYTIEFIEQVTHWIDKNPFLYSINWCMAMDVSLRAVNWLYALNMFINSNHVNKEFLKTILHSLYQHGCYIEMNLEKGYKYRANHHDANLVGLLFLGLLFKNTKRGKKWFIYSKHALFNEIRSQILPSGMEYEAASFYNRLVLEMFSYSVFLLKRNFIHIPNDIEYRIWKMFSFIREISFPDGDLPVFGDQDNGRFLPFDLIYRNDVSYLNAIAKNYYDDEAFTQIENASEVFFLLKAGKNISYKGCPKLEPNNIPKAYFDIGIFKMISNDLFVLINNSSPGKYIDDIFSGGSHAHADLLSFVLAYKGRQVFIDPGSYVYTSDYKARNFFRSTIMHNTVTIDNQSQFKTNPKNLFSFDTSSQVNNINYSISDTAQLYIGEHNAYSYIEESLKHKREFCLRVEKNILSIKDFLLSIEEHQIVINFHCHPSIELVKKNEFIQFKLDDIIIAKFSIITQERINIEIKDSFFSPSFGVKLKNSLISISFETKNESEIESIIEFF